jgi:putative cell wall-binding protein
VIKNIPILLTAPDTLSPETANFIRTNSVTKVTIIGGTSVVSSSIENSLRQSYGCQVERFAGGDRYQTARIATVGLVARYGLKPALAGVATGEAFPDALSGGAAMGARGGVLLLTTSQALRSETKEVLNTLKPNKPAIEILGGTSAISDGVQQAIKTHMGY